MLKKISINKICIWAFALRLLMLVAVMSIGKNLSTGLIGSTYSQDDVRYLAGAELYSEYATQIIDSNAIEKAFDEVEPLFAHDQGIELWYWIISILMYLLRSEFLVRLLNILFAIVSVKCIYDICIYLYDEKVAKIASLLYAILPYPVIFSCFLYKDQFYTMLTLLLFLKAFQCAGHIRLKDVLLLSFGLLISQLTRSGLAVIILAAILLIIYNHGHYRIKKIYLVFVVLAFVGIITMVVVFSWEQITRKVYAYILDKSQAGEATISYFVIKSPVQLYRYPFAYLFALLQPLNLSCVIKTWMDLAGILNITIIPVALGNIYYFLNFKVPKIYFFWIAQVFYFVAILASLGIIRHQYFLQPFMMIFFACYLYTRRNKYVLTISSLLACLGVMIIWFYQNL